jgi:hypothetical protein
MREGVTDIDSVPDFVVRDMNYFVSHAGIISNATISHIFEE